MGRLHLPRTVRESVLAGALLGSLLPAGFLALQLWAGQHLRVVAAERTGPPATLRAAPAAPPAELAGRLLFPVPGVLPSAMHNSFDEPRGVRTHHAVDIPAPRGSPVVAVADGTLVALSTSPAGGLSLFLLDASAGHCYLYAHLDSYGAGLAAGQAVRRGQLLAYVGTSGNAPPHLPHLHFAIAKVVTAGACWGGPAVDPYPVFR